MPCCNTIQSNNEEGVQEKKINFIQVIKLQWQIEEFRYLQNMF